MLEDHLDSPCTCRRLREGPAGPHIDAFVEWLVRAGYRPVSVTQRLKALATWTDWILRIGTAADCAGALADYEGALLVEGRLRYVKGHFNNALVAARIYVRFLREAGILSEATREPTALETWPILADYHAWGKQHCGYMPSTSRMYEAVVADLLQTLGDDPAALTAEGLRSFVLDRARRHGRARGSTYVTALRSYLRFLVMIGRCREGLPDAVPSFASWKLSSIPRHLEPQVLERVVEACGGEASVRRRDRAAILLLARLGLRGGDVERLTFEDIDWQGGRVAVSGKSRRREWLPLPQDVGDAILDYLENGRPKVNVPQVFVTAVAPYRPLAAGSLKNVAETALRRAGVEAPSYGSHVFRHSAATSMLRQGVSLAGIAAILRHRSPDTTMRYAKVDFGLLADVTQPWPEVSSC